MGNFLDVVRAILRVRRVVFSAAIALALLLPLGLSMLAVPAFGQEDPGDALTRALRQHGGTGDDNDTTPPSPAIQNFRPVVPSIPDTKRSQLETLYSARAGRALTQFGYETLGVPASIAVAQSGAIQDSYVIGSGDVLVVVLRGQENATYRLRVTRDGQVILPKLNPILASGRSFGDFRSDLESQVAQAYISTKVFVSLGEVHQLSVLVSGEVRTPGMRVVSALASPLDAILLSGGISKTGSLRNIRLIRGGTSRIVDLYSVLTRAGSGSSLGSLRDGDRIFVPPLGATVAVAGSVRRPGIYELGAGQSRTSVTSLLQVAGGVQIAGRYDLSKVRVESNGVIRLVPIAKSAAVDSGEVLFVDASQGATIDQVTALGAVLIVGSRPLGAAHSVDQLLGSLSNLSPSAYGLFAVIARRDPSTNAVTLAPFSIARAFSKPGSVQLQGNDTIYVFERNEIRALASVVTKNVNEPFVGLQPANPLSQRTPAPPQTPSSSPASDDNTSTNGAAEDTNSATSPAAAPSNPPQQPLSRSQPFAGLAAAPGSDLRDNAARQNDTEGAASVVETQNLLRRQSGVSSGAGQSPLLDIQLVRKIASSLGVGPDALISVARENLIWVVNGVRNPGPYLSATGNTLSDVLLAAGGVSQQADLSAIEVTSSLIDQSTGLSTTTRTSYAIADGSFSDVTLRALDVVRVREVYSDRENSTVTVAGQVRYPGIFDIMRDERLSSILQRAGGLTDVAYPYGTVFTRRTAAISEREGNQRSAREIEIQLASLASNTVASGQSGSSDISYVEKIIQRLRDQPALGRVMVTADPTVLATKPELDVVLEPGDTVYIPKRPSSVTVTGEVMNPGAFQYRSELSAQDYVRLAGGVSRSAESGRTFIVLPDGSANPLSEDWLSFGAQGRIPPGSTIVVPRNLKPFDWLQLVKDIAQIASQLAITAATLSVLK